MLIIPLDFGFLYQVIPTTLLGLYSSGLNQLAYPDRANPESQSGLGCRNEAHFARLTAHQIVVNANRAGSKRDIPLEKLKSLRQFQNAQPPVPQEDILPPPQPIPLPYVGIPARSLPRKTREL
jgi:hypothetical protein